MAVRETSKMELYEIRSSSNDLSSAPNSDDEEKLFHTHSTPNNQNVSTPHTSAPGNKSLISNVSNVGVSSVKKPSKPRPKKPTDPNAPPKEKKPRKPKDSLTSTNTSNKPRKKVKTEDALPSGMLLHLDNGAQGGIIPKTVHAAPVSANSIYEAAKASQYGNDKQDVEMMYSPPSKPIQHLNPNSQQQPAKSRQIFDPVRGIERTSELSKDVTYPSIDRTPPSHPVPPQQSPSLKGLLNPAEQPYLSPYSRQSDFRPTLLASVSNHDAIDLLTPSPPAKSVQPHKSSILEQSVSDVEKKKPKRAKEVPPPVPMGSGLLGKSLFGGIDVEEKPVDNPTIILKIDLKQPGNQIVNFARMAEEKYGFAALYPRQAAQKKRMAEMAAAGALIEKQTGKAKGAAVDSGDDDLSGDIDRDSTDDGDVHMGGVNGTNNNSGTDAPVKKARRNKNDEYDMDDGFVDDSEMLWENQQATAKDGFFVYCGPLVPEVDKSATERSDTSKRGRGRGRAGGTGSRGARGSGTTTSEKRGGSVGARGIAATRKPRAKKADKNDRAEFEARKKEVEKKEPVATGKQITVPA